MGRGRGTLGVGVVVQRSGGVVMAAVQDFGLQFEKLVRCEGVKVGVGEGWASGRRTHLNKRRPHEGIQT